MFKGDIHFFNSKSVSYFQGSLYNKQYLEKLPIIIPKQTDVTQFELYIKIDEFSRKIVELKNDPKKIKDAEFLEKKIDELVYKLYGLTDEEIKIVEGN